MSVLLICVGIALMACAAGWDVVANLTKTRVPDAVPWAYVLGGAAMLLGDGTTARPNLASELLAAVLMIHAERRLGRCKCRR